MEVVPGTWAGGGALLLCEPRSLARLPSVAAKRRRAPIHGDHGPLAIRLPLWRRGCSVDTPYWTTGPCAVLWQSGGVCARAREHGSVPGPRGPSVTFLGALQQVREHGRG